MMCIAATKVPKTVKIVPTRTNPSMRFRSSIDKSFNCRFFFSVSIQSQTMREMPKSNAMLMRVGLAIVSVRKTARGCASVPVFASTMATSLPTTSIWSASRSVGNTSSRAHFQRECSQSMACSVISNASGSSTGCCPRHSLLLVAWNARRINGGRIRRMSNSMASDVRTCTESSGAHPATFHTASISGFRPRMTSIVDARAIGLRTLRTAAAVVAREFHAHGAEAAETAE